MLFNFIEGIVIIVRKMADNWFNTLHKPDFIWWHSQLKLTSTELMHEIWAKIFMTQTEYSLIRYLLPLFLSIQFYLIRFNSIQFDSILNLSTSVDSFLCGVHYLCVLMSSNTVNQTWKMPLLSPYSDRYAQINGVCCVSMAMAFAFFMRHEKSLDTLHWFWIE